MKKLVIFCSLITMSGLQSIAKQPFDASSRDPEIRHYLADYHYRTAPIIPTDLTQFYFSPECEKSIVFKLNNRYEWKNVHRINYIIYNYAGEKFKSGTVEVNAGKIKLDLVLPQGYFEINFTRYNETFGVCSMPAYTGKRDPFFGLGSGFTFYVRDRFRKSWSGIYPDAAYTQYAKFVNGTT